MKQTPNLISRFVFLLEQFNIGAGGRAAAISYRHVAGPQASSLPHLNPQLHFPRPTLLLLQHPRIKKITSKRVHWQ